MEVCEKHFNLKSNSGKKLFFMYQKQNNKWVGISMVLIIAIGSAIGWLVAEKQPSIVKKYLPAQAQIISSKKTRVRHGKEGYKWVMRHKAYFTLEDYDYAFHFTCKIGSYRTGDTVDILYNPKRPRTVIVYSVPENAIILTEDAQLDHIYLNYEDIKAFFDSVKIESKNE